MYYSSELVRVPSLLVEGYELPARALVHRYTDVEHSFIVIDVNKRGRVACTALTTTPYVSSRTHTHTSRTLTAQHTAC